MRNRDKTSSKKTACYFAQTIQQRLFAVSAFFYTYQHSSCSSSFLVKQCAPQKFQLNKTNCVSQTHTTHTVDVDELTRCFSLLL
jgi:hypothetical protein